ncbi:MAG TPA: hypothetical protein VNN07_01345, partial [Candidatus Tectomicrobia bacterium]|nr:hypothetical protein [Candidatus Tectomicrobia bacterium]
NGWHRAFRGAVERFLTAHAAGDEAALVEFVPDRALRQRLPPALRAEPVCDARETPGGEAVSVAAVDGAGRPWTLVFRRAGTRWRLTAARPVLQ